MLPELSLRNSSSSQPEERPGATLNFFVKVRCGYMLQIFMSALKRVLDTLVW